MRKCGGQGRRPAKGRSMYTHDFDWTKAEITTAGAAFARSLRALGSSTRIPNHTWTAGEVGAHVLAMFAFYDEMAMHLDDYPIPTAEMGGVDELARRNMEAVGTYHPAELADLIEPGVATWLDGLGDDPMSPRGWWVPSHAQGVAGAALGELLLHRDDLARLTGEQVNVTRAQAIAILEGVLPGAAAFCNPDAAARCEGTFHLKLRGATDWTIVVADRSLTVSRGKPTRADLHFNLDPVSALLVSYGRANPYRAALTGKQVAYGRKPWLALPFSTLVAAP